MHSRGDLEALKRFIPKVTRLSLLATCPLVALILVSSPLYFALFGSGFERATTALHILLVAQSLNVLAGPVGLYLIAVGREWEVAIGVGASLLLNITLNAVLIPEHGVSGAALATAASIALWNIALTMMIWFKGKMALNAFAGLRKGEH